MDKELEKKLTQRKERILEFMTQASYKPLLITELEGLLLVPKSDKEIFVKTINELEIEGKIFKTKQQQVWNSRKNESCSRKTAGP